MQETEVEEFLRFAQALVYNIPDEEGVEWGVDIAKKFDGDSYELALFLVDFISGAAGYDSKESIACLLCSISISWQLLFDTDYINEPEVV